MRLDNLSEKLLTYRCQYIIIITRGEYTNNSTKESDMITCLFTKKKKI